MDSDRLGMMRPPSTALASTTIPPQQSRPTTKRPAHSQQQDPLSHRRPAAPRQTSSNSPLLKLNPDLPPVGKYHPLNYCSPHNTRPGSAHSNLNMTPSAPSPNGAGPSYLNPISPRAHVRNLSQVERRLHDYYRDRAVNASRQALTPGAPGEKPNSPRLVPALSPGVVTPLELENANSYFAGVKTRSGSSSPMHTRNRSRDSLSAYGAWTDGFSFEGSGAMSPMSPRTPPAIF